MPIGQFFRLNFLMLMERRAPFFARKSYLNDPVDCAPNLLVDVPDAVLTAIAKKALSASGTGDSRHLELRQLVDALTANDADGRDLDTLHHKGLFGITMAGDLPTLLGGTYAGSPLRDIAKAVLREHALDQISEPLIFSTSETINEPLLWGHYAGSHRGIAVGLTGLRSKRAGIYGDSVEYSNRRPTVTLDETLHLNEDTHSARESTRKVFFRKSHDWEKEREYRLVARQVSKNFAYPELRLPEGSFIQLPDLRIKSLIFGSQCTDQGLVVDLVEQTCRDENFPELLQASLSASDYGLDLANANKLYRQEKPLSSIVRALLGRGTTDPVQELR